MYINHDPEIDKAIEKLGQDFTHLNWDFSPKPGSSDLVSHWLGEESEEVMVNVFKGKRINERFHRQDFVFIHFAYRGDYDALSAKYNNRITIKEGSSFRLPPCLSVKASPGKDRQTLLAASARSQNAQSKTSFGTHGSFHRKNCCHAELQQ